MIFDVYNPIKTKEGALVPGVKPEPRDWGWIVDNILKAPKWNEQIDKYRETGDKTLKASLPSINFVGRSTTTRKASAMTPTQLFMIDIDHCEDARGAWQKMFDQVGNEWICDNVMLAHLSPSLGIHIIFKQQGFPTLIENMDYVNNIFDFGQYGEYDTKVKDFSRVSFAFKHDELLFENAMLYLETEPDLGNVLKNEFQVSGSKFHEVQGGKGDVPVLTDEEKEKFDNVEWRGIKVKKILDTYIEAYGEPSEGEIHNYYNELVKYFRGITDNNKKCLLHILPRFGHTEEECWSQIKSICRTNTLSQLPSKFYYFLQEHGLYRARGTKADKDLMNYMMADNEREKIELPYLPPVFREFVKICPPDFIIPTINALLPVMGTLTSYVKAIYPYDAREHTTSFFSIIYAPPGTGKGFVERIQDILLKDLRVRDFISNKREQLYLNAVNRKKDNERAPENPHTVLRIVPPKNSEAEFLSKMEDNKGYHMFTYAAEMDSWAKGVKAAGGNKDDMIRIAWDNGKYGQMFKSSNTFKGEVNLFWNVLITGTLDQLMKYFKNVENGLVTRCSFTPIENQEFAAPPLWKALTPKDLNAIETFVKRCDENSYQKPCEYDMDDLPEFSEDVKEFDKEIDWHFKYKEKQLVDLSWIMPTIDKFHKEQVALALKDVDKARDVFRRRVGVRGFRLALMCTCLYRNPRKAEFDKCKEFIWWWMHQDIENMLKLWGAKYNEQADETPSMSQREVFAALGNDFTKEDVYSVCLKQGIKTNVRTIIYMWKNEGFIEKISKNKFKKK